MGLGAKGDSVEEAVNGLGNKAAGQADGQYFCVYEGKVRGLWTAPEQDEADRSADVEGEDGHQAWYTKIQGAL